MATCVAIHNIELAWPAPPLVLFAEILKSCRPSKGSLYFHGVIKLPTCCARTFLRGALDKVGVEPNMKRIGKFNSAGDQLLRKEMSEAQREQLTAILDNLYESFTDDVEPSKGQVLSRGKHSRTVAHCILTTPS